MANHLPPLQPKNVLCVIAHPDDIDFCAGGSVAKWVSEGASVYYYILTNGNKGTSDRSIQPDQLRDMRRNEQRAAAQLLGVRDVFFNNFEDGGLEVSQQVKHDIVRIIRQVKPDTLVTFDPSMLYQAEFGMVNHSDHRAVGQAAMDAVYPLARDHLSFPDLLMEGLQPHNVATLLLINWAVANTYVDISMYMDKKLSAIAAHTSQVSDLASMTETVKHWATTAGAHAGYQYAETFVRIDVQA